MLRTTDLDKKMEKEDLGSDWIKITLLPLSLFNLTAFNKPSFRNGFGACTLDLGKSDIESLLLPNKVTPSSILTSEPWSSQL